MDVIFVLPDPDYPLNESNQKKISVKKFFFQNLQVDNPKVPYLNMYDVRQNMVNLPSLVRYFRMFFLEIHS
jgi:hypothetical protein